MKTIFKTAITAMATMLIFAACGNAGAKTADRKDKDGKGKGVVELNAKTFNEQVYDLTLEELAAEYKGKIVIYKVDIDKERGLAEAFNVSSIPAVLFIPKGNEEPVMTVGSRGKEKFQEQIETILLTE